MKYFKAKHNRTAQEKSKTQSALFKYSFYFRQLQQIWASHRRGREQDLHQHWHWWGFFCCIVFVPLPQCPILNPQAMLLAISPRTKPLNILLLLDIASFALFHSAAKVLRINDKDYSITFATYFNVEWYERRLKVVKELEVKIFSTHLTKPNCPPNQTKQNHPPNQTEPNQTTYLHHTKVAEVMSSYDQLAQGLWSEPEPKCTLFCGEINFASDLLASCVYYF